MTKRDEQGGQVFLIDDHPAVRGGLAVILEQEAHRVCGEADNLQEARERIDPMATDLCLLDLSLCGENGLDILGELQEMGISVLVYSMHEDAATIEETFVAGADGYVTKRETAEVLLEAVAALRAGERFVSPRAAQSLAHKVLPSARNNPMNKLSLREREVLGLLGKGDATVDIAAAFSIGERTVETYYKRIIVKLGLDGMKALRQFAIRNKSL